MAKRKSSHEDFDRDHVAAHIDALRLFIANAATNRGEAAMILGAVLADVLRVGVAPERREELLDQIITMVRKLWEKEDELERKSNIPVM